MKISFEKAKQIAVEFLNSNYHVENDSLVILDEETIERKYGWYFFSSSKKFRETMDISDMVVGNGIILVKENGEVIEFGTSLSPESYIEAYENQLLH